MLISLGYIVACVRSGDRVWTVRGHELYLPPWRMAVLQMAISCLNWSLMAGVIYVLLGQKIAYTDVLTVLLIGAIAGVVAHVPAGLGVFEFVFMALLSHLGLWPPAGYRHLLIVPLLLWVTRAESVTVLIRLPTQHCQSSARRVPIAHRG